MGVKRKVVVVAAGQLMSVAWAVFVIVLLIAAWESWRETPLENGFYYAFIYGCAIYLITYVNSYDSIYQRFQNATRKLGFPGKIVLLIYKISQFVILFPAKLIRKTTALKK